VLAPAHLLVCKAVFNHRPKDWLDIEQILVCVDDLDTGEVGMWLDPRKGRFDALADPGE
jgi:hypothetical protein